MTEEQEERRHMPEDEKYQFRLVEWVMGLGALLIAAAIIWGGASIIDLKEEVSDVSADMKLIKKHIEDSDAFHEKIPDGFFTQRRWGLTDELKAQALLDRQMAQGKALHLQQMALLDKKLALLDKRMDSQDREIDIWKGMIKGLIEMHQSNGGHK